MNNNEDENVAQLIEINLMFAQMELSVGAGEDAATLRALDHIMEALKHLRDEMPCVSPGSVKKTVSVKQPGDFG